MRILRKRFVMVTGNFVVLGLVAMSPISFAQDMDQTRATLRALKGVEVLVESFNPEIEKDGLLSGQLRADIEAKLRMAGITVLREKERAITPPMLCIDAQVTKPISSLYVFHVEIALRQNVLLQRDQGIMVHGVTWSRGKIGNTHNISEIRQYITDKVDQFIDAYLSVNQR